MLPKTADERENNRKLIALLPILFKNGFGSVCSASKHLAHLSIQAAVVFREHTYKK